MRWKAPRSQPELTLTGGPADTATVVIGIDGRPASWDAFCWACREARRLGGRVICVFISPAAQAGLAATAGSAVPDLAVTEPARQLLDRMLREAGHLDLTFIDAPGDPVTELHRVARQMHADLVVIGASAAGRPWLTGRVGQRLVARCRESVIAVVPAAAKDTQPADHN